MCQFVGYELCRLSLCVGSPQCPVSDELYAAHVFCCVVYGTVSFVGYELCRLSLCVVYGTVSFVGYELCRLSLCVGSPQCPVSDELYAAHVFCWKVAVVDYLQKCRQSSHRVGLTVSGQFIKLLPYICMPFVFVLCRSDIICC